MNECTKCVPSGERIFFEGHPLKECPACTVLKEKEGFSKEIIRLQGELADAEYELEDLSGRLRKVEDLCEKAMNAMSDVLNAVEG